MENKTVWFTKCFSLKRLCWAYCHEFSCEHKRQQQVTHTNAVIFLGFTLWNYHRAWVIWRIKRIELFITLHILNKTDTIEDFLQMIFKIIIQTLQTNNTSASQSEITSQQSEITLEITSENIQNLRASVKVRGGWDRIFPKRKHLTLTSYSAF